MSLNTAGDGIAVKRVDQYPGRPWIIFFHDSLGCIELWRDFPNKLGELTRCNILVYDRRGYGKSAPFSNPLRDKDYLEQEADMLIDLIQQWKIERPFLFGHSDGGSIALIAAGKYPDRFRGIITEGAHIYVEEVTIQGIKEALRLYETTDLKSRLLKYHGNKTEAMFRAWVDTWTAGEFRNWNIEHFLPQINCPVLVIQGEEDEFATQEQANKIADLSGGRSLIVPGSGHSPHKEQQAIVLEEASGFIKKKITSERSY